MFGHIFSWMNVICKCSTTAAAGDIDDVRYKKEHPEKLHAEFYEDDDKLVCCLLLSLFYVIFIFSVPLKCYSFFRLSAVDTQSLKKMMCWRFPSWTNSTNKGRLIAKNRMYVVYV